MRNVPSEYFLKQHFQKYAAAAKQIKKRSALSLMHLAAVSKIHALNILQLPQMLCESR